MSYEIIQGPYMLLEVVGMLFKFVNGTSFKTVLDRHRFLTGNTVSDAMTRRMNCLQQIMEDVCADLDPQDPRIQRFFGRVELENGEACLAEMLTFTPFITLKHQNVREHGAEICRIWHRFQERGLWISPNSNRSFTFVNEGTCPGDLFDQIRTLRFSAEYKIELYNALRNFDQTIEELIDLVEPLADRLAGWFRQEHWMVDEAEEYWREAFTSISPIDFLRSSYDSSIENDTITEHTQVALAYMNSNVISFAMGNGAGGCPGDNVLILGSVATVNSVASSSRGNLETVSTLLKTLGDKKRLEVLRRLSKNRSYCHELADIMGVDPGNMSRTLTMLHRYGLLRQEREPLINYYQADREAVHSFLMLVESVIFD